MIPHTLELTQTINATPQMVYKAWTQPELINQWWCTPGFQLKSVEMDLRPGGAYRYELLPEEGPSCIMEGQFQEVSAPTKLVYSWTIRVADYAVTDTTVTVLFQANGDKTELSLVHTGFTKELDFELHAKDWPIVLAQLAELVRAPKAAF